MSELKFIYAFEDGDGSDRILLGGKGANLCAMTQIGLNVPPGFVITTAACLAFLESQRLPDGLMDEVRTHIAALARKTGKGFGSATNPLLVSVRSGSAMSMPGMMDTILNLGLNEATLQGLAARTGNARFAWDAYRRFIQLFGKIAMGVPDEAFDAAMAAIKGKHGAVQDIELAPTRCRSSRRPSLPSIGSARAGPFRRTLTSSSSFRSRRYSSRGTAGVRSIIDGSSGSRRQWPTARRSTSARWSSGTWVRILRPASVSPAIRPPARTSSTASTS